jgi:hypothetical protein
MWLEETFQTYFSYERFWYLWLKIMSEKSLCDRNSNEPQEIF